MPQWNNPTNGLLVGNCPATTTDGGLALPLPDFTVDLAGTTHAPPTLTMPSMNLSSAFEFQWASKFGEFIQQRNKPSDYIG